MSGLTAWERWELASFDAPEKLPLPQKDVVLPTAADIEHVHQQARDEGYREGRQAGYEEGIEEGRRAGHEEGRQAGHEEGLKAGHAEGLQAGHEEGRSRAQDEAGHLARAATQLDQALAELDRQVADELLALAIEIARQVVRGELVARPEAILDGVREALAQLPHQHASIYLHPDDASLVRSWAGDALAHAGHRIHEDARLQRGDCLIEAGGSQVDATVSTRWRRVIENLGLSGAWVPKEPG